MTDKEAEMLVEWPELADYYLSIVSAYKNDEKKLKLTTNYLLSDYMGLVKDKELADFSIVPRTFAELVIMAANGDVSSRGAKDILALLVKEKDVSPKSLAEKHNLLQKSDVGDLAPVIDKVIADNVKVVAEYKAGKIASLQFLIGQVMKATGGSANPAVVKELLEKKLRGLA
jgi:aspartyl-tRNA(Asn)/glutamyl-tRNA(Gln) amidotransferase subunit B